MSAERFERLLYTDCLPGTGRGAGGGFQVQAQSAGVDAAQSAAAVRWLLYDVPSAWTGTGRPVEDFPPGLAHTDVEGWGTAQSRYLGKEAKGGRQGNHLADCLLTRTPEVYGPVRPAQLWQAPHWREEAWPATECPPLDGPLQTGPLTVDAAQAWLREDGARVPALMRILTVLEGGTTRRVVLTATTPEQALAWIVAATLLLPVRAALAVSFKVFTSNPNYAQHRVLAVSRELAPQVAPGRGGPDFVVDAGSGLTDEVVPSERARFWVERLRDCDDPYDVVDAVELERVLSGAAPSSPHPRSVAWTLASGDPATLDSASFLAWLTTAGPDLLAEHTGAITATVVAADSSSELLRALDALAGTGALVTNRAAVRRRLLAAELAEVRAGGTVVEPPLDRVELGDDAARDVEGALSSAIVLAGDAEVDVLLRLAYRHRISPAVKPLLGRLAAFAGAWVAEPRRDYRPSAWALRDELLDLVRDALQDRVGQHGPASITSAAEHLWPLLQHTASDARDPVDAALLTAALGAASRAERPDLLRNFVGRALATRDPAASVAALQRMLTATDALRPGDALALALRIPADMPVERDVADAAAADLERDAARSTTAATLATIASLRERGARLAPRLLILEEGARDLAAVLDAVGRARSQEDAAALGARLRDLDPAVTAARRREIVETVLATPRPAVAASVLAALDTATLRSVVEEWARRLGEADGARWAAWGFRLLRWPGLRAGVGRYVTVTLHRHARELSSEDRVRWPDAVADRLPAAERTDWHAFVAEPAETAPRESRRWIPTRRGR